VESVVLARRIPSLRAVHVVRSYSLGIPRSPCLLQQYIKALGMLSGRCRISLTWILIKGSMFRIVVIGGRVSEGSGMKEEGVM